MKIEYKTERVDFIVFQLFSASKSDRIKRTRKRTRTVVPIIYVIVGLLLFLISDIVPGLVFFGIGVAWYLIMPYYLKSKHRRHYENHIDENYKGRFGKQVVLVFEDEFFTATDYLGESKLKIREITEINEIKDYIFMKLSSGDSLIIPITRISNQSELNSIISKITSDLNINHNVDLNWKWS